MLRIVRTDYVFIVNGLPHRPLLLLMRRTALVFTLALALLAAAQRSPAAVPEAFKAIDATTRAAFEQQGLSGMGLSIYDAQGNKVFEQMYGDFAADRRIPIASASKLVAGLTILRLVDQGKLSLDSTTGQVLGWKGPQGAITLKQLLSFTSGLPPRDACTLRPGITLAECVSSLSKLKLVARAGYALRLRQYASACRGPHGRGRHGQDLERHLRARSCARRWGSARRPSSTPGRAGPRAPPIRCSRAVCK